MSVVIFGTEFGELTALDPVLGIKGNKETWTVCSCGKITKVRNYHLTSGATRSCGSCGWYKKFPSEYSSWWAMNNRCSNEEFSHYEYYGGKGIVVCDAWKRFVNFLNDMGLKPTEDHTIDRKDTTLGYYKENCRWATRAIQALNRSDSRGRYGQRN